MSPDELVVVAELDIEGRMPWSSNATFLVTLRLDDVEARAVYKPGKGERPRVFKIQMRPDPLAR